MHLYAMTACISRASRSIAWGIRNHDHELDLTRAICEESITTVMDLVEEIKLGTLLDSCCMCTCYYFSNRTCEIDQL